MKKLRIEIDAPETCGHCAMCQYSAYHNPRCGADIVDEVNCDTRPAECKELDVEVDAKKCKSDCASFDGYTMQDCAECTRNDEHQDYYRPVVEVENADD